MFFRPIGESSEGFHADATPPSSKQTNKEKQRKWAHEAKMTAAINVKLLTAKHKLMV
jgi:hypothetical protein